MIIVAILIGKFISFLSQLFGLGAGATWSGEIALRLCPTMLQQFSLQGPTIILIAGTNGKTTTSKMIETILAGNGYRVCRNDTGANLDNGIVATFLRDATMLGRLKSTHFIFEVDEAMLPKVVSGVKGSEPKLIIVLLNLFRDQLDRYGEVDAIAEKWMKAFSSFWQTSRRVRPESILMKDAGQASMTENMPVFIINADDPTLAWIGSKISSVSYFGLDDPSKFLPVMQHATDAIYCPRCGGRLTFGGVYYGHLGKWACGTCGFTHPPVDLTSADVQSPLPGVYNIYNALAAMNVAMHLGISKADIQRSLMTFSPAFGRMETLTVHDKKIIILLSKNPTGFNESLRTAIAQGASEFLFVLNDRIPDGRDVSWIWDVDFEVLSGNYRIVVAGDRCYDMALRLKYAGIDEKKTFIYKNLKHAIEESTRQGDLKQALWILPTYSAMLEVRKILTGKKIS